MLYLIDGYNVLHKLQGLKEGSFKASQEKFIGLLEIFSLNQKNAKIKVVFDGKGKFYTNQAAGVKVVFAGDISADRKIKDLLNHASFARDICVVSDDREIKAFARRFGARHLGVDKFLKSLWKIFKRYNKIERNKANLENPQHITEELKKIWLKG